MAKDAGTEIKKYLADMHALESHGLQAISRQAEQLQDAKHTDAWRAAQGFQTTLERHAAALDQRLKALSGSGDWAVLSPATTTPCVPRRHPSRYAMTIPSSATAPLRI